MTTGVERLQPEDAAHHELLIVALQHLEIAALRGTTIEGQQVHSIQVHSRGVQQGTTGEQCLQVEDAAHPGTITVQEPLEAYLEITSMQHQQPEAEAHHGLTTGVEHLLGEDAAHQGMTRELIIEDSHRL